MATHSSFLACGQRNLGGYSPWDCQGSDMTEVLGMHAFKARLLGYLNDISIIVIEK